MQRLKYLSQINAFYDWLVTNPLGASAITLWHALMHVANISGWPEDFTVAISSLHSFTGCGKDAIYAARNQLKQKGRIDFREQKGRQSTIYRIIPFVSEFQTQTPTQTPTQLPTRTPTQTPNNIRLDKTREEFIRGGAGDARARATEITPESLFSRFIGGVPTTAERERCAVWLGQHDPDLVWTAFHKACMAGKKNLAYIGGILGQYDAREIHDLGDVAEDDLRHRKI